MLGVGFLRIRCIFLWAICPHYCTAIVRSFGVLPVQAILLSTFGPWSGDRNRSPSNIGSLDVSEALQRAVRQLLRPLVKALIAGGITFPVLVDFLREIYVDVAKSDYGLKGKEPTSSRITLLTGVHRKEIRRMVGRLSPSEAPSEKISLSAKAIAVWCSKPEYMDADGRPLPLARTTLKGTPSLEQLVASVSVDVRPRTLLEEWLRAGIVELEDDKVSLVQTALIPDGGFEEKAYYFGRNLRDHIAAGTHNLAGSTPVFFDRAVYYDRIEPESIEELRRFCARRGEELLLEINRHTRKLAERDRAIGEPNGRMTFGAYFFAEDYADGTSADIEHEQKK